jgi:xylan 1,4-beta-xylosidase
VADSTTTNAPTDNFFDFFVPLGATEFGHRATLARAPSVWGPFEPCPSNPVLTAPSETALFQTVGHADFFPDRTDIAGEPASKWWAVCLASRVVDGAWPIGRETCLVEIDWSGEWPIAELSSLDPGQLPAKFGSEELEKQVWEDLLAPPHHSLLYLRNPEFVAYDLTKAHESELILRPQGGRPPLTDPFGSPTFIGVRQRHLHFICEVTVDLDVPDSLAPGELVSGLAVYQDHEHHFTFAVRFNDNTSSKHSIVLGGASMPSALGPINVPATAKSVTLQVCGYPDRYEFAMGTAREGGNALDWISAGTGAAKAVNGVFTGVIIALYAEKASETASDAAVTMRGWRYKATGA